MNPSLPTPTSGRGENRIERDGSYMMRHLFLPESRRCFGHSQITMTLDVYSHVLPSMQEDVTKRWDDDFGAPVPVPVR